MEKWFATFGKKGLQKTAYLMANHEREINLWIHVSLA